MSERDGYAHGVPCWVDTWQDDADAAAASTPASSAGRPRAAEYSMSSCAGATSPASGRRAEGQPAWTTYVWVDGADATAATARAAGGSVVAEPFDSLDGGRMAMIADPAGAVVGVWEPGEHRGAQLVNEPGAWSMSMLSTPDTETRGGVLQRGVRLGDRLVRAGTMFRLPGFVGGEPSSRSRATSIAVMAPGRAGGAGGPTSGSPTPTRPPRRAGELGGQIVMGPFDTPPRTHRGARRPGRRRVLGQQGALGRAEPPLGGVGQPPRPSPRRPARGGPCTQSGVDRAERLDAAHRLDRDVGARVRDVSSGIIATHRPAATNARATVTSSTT